MEKNYDYAVILGSGLSKFVEHMDIEHQGPISEILGKELTVAGHSGEVYFGQVGSTRVICCQGRPHWYEGRTGDDFYTFINALKSKGIHSLIVTNAAGGLCETYYPGQIVLINDHINFQWKTPLIGRKDSDRSLFLNQDAVYDANMMAAFHKAANQLDEKLEEGVYMSVLGPCFETPAEVRAFKMLGADVIGMSSIPEVVTARYLDIKVAMISIIVNLGAGMSDEQLSHEHTLEMAAKADIKLASLLKQFMTTN